MFQKVQGKVVVEEYFWLLSIPASTSCYEALSNTDNQEFFHTCKSLFSEPPVHGVELRPLVHKTLNKEQPRSGGSLWIRVLTVQGPEFDSSTHIKIQFCVYVYNSSAVCRREGNPRGSLVTSLARSRLIERPCLK